MKIKEVILVWKKDKFMFKRSDKTLVITNVMCLSKLLMACISLCLFDQGSLTPPVATTIFFGANDAALKGRTSDRQHVPVEEYKDNIRTMVQHLKVPTYLTLLNCISSCYYSNETLFAEMFTYHANCARHSTTN